MRQVWKPILVNLLIWGLLATACQSSSVSIDEPKPRLSISLKLVWPQNIKARQKDETATAERSIVSSPSITRLSVVLDFLHNHRDRGFEIDPLRLPPTQVLVDIVDNADRISIPLPDTLVDTVLGLGDETDADLDVVIAVQAYAAEFDQPVFYGYSSPFDILGRSEESVTIPLVEDTRNLPPVAFIQAATSRFVAGKGLELNAEASLDPEDDPRRYCWFVLEPGKSEPEIFQSTSIKLDSLTSGEWIAELRVGDATLPPDCSEIPIFEPLESDDPLELSSQHSRLRFEARSCSAGAECEDAGLVCCQESDTEKTDSLSAICRLPDDCNEIIGGNLSVSPLSIDFGVVQPNDQLTREITITNVGNSSANIRDLLFEPADRRLTFAGIEQDTLPRSIAPEESLTVEIYLKGDATSIGPVESTFLIMEEDNPRKVKIKGIVSAGASVSFRPDDTVINFGSLAANAISATELLRIFNTSGDGLPLQIIGIDINNLSDKASVDDETSFILTNWSDFTSSSISDIGLPITIEAADVNNDSIQPWFDLFIQFAPSRIGEYLAELVITTDAPNQSRYAVLLRGRAEGVASTPPCFYEPEVCEGHPDMKTIPGTCLCMDQYEAVVVDTDFFNNGECSGSARGRIYNQDTDTLSNILPIDVAIDNLDISIFACAQEEQRPSVFVSFNQAALACRRAGKTLCPSDIWTRACKGYNGALCDNQASYPYGCDYEPGLCNDIWRWQDETATPRALPASEMWDCSNDWHFVNMSGNVREWAVNEGNPVLRGGSFEVQSGSTLSCDDEVGVERLQQQPDIGFRCCVEVTQNSDAAR